MYGNEFTQNSGFIPIAPQDLNDALVKSNRIDMSQYGLATVYVMVGDTAGATFTITLKQSSSNTGTGEKALAYTKLRSTGQKLNIDTVVGTFSVGETITGGTSALTAEVHTISKDYLLVRCLTGGTTWTDNETITGGTSGATAVMDGTGQDEDILLTSYTAPASTFTVPAVTFKTYAIDVDTESLDVDAGFRYLSVNLSDPGGATIAGGCIVLNRPRFRGIPMPATLGTKKMAATVA